MHSKCKICPYAPKENLVIDIGYNSSESGVLPDSVLFGGTVLSNSVLFAGAVLQHCVLFGRTVPPNSFPQYSYSSLGDGPRFVASEMSFMT